MPELYRIRKIIEYTGTLGALGVHMPRTVQSAKTFQVKGYGDITITVRSLSDLPEPVWPREQSVLEQRRRLTMLRDRAEHGLEIGNMGGLKDALQAIVNLCEEALQEELRPEEVE